MMKVVLLLFAGVCVGYWIGWDDAQVYSKPIYVRAVEAVGGKNRQNLKSDPDAQIDSLEKH